MITKAIVPVAGLGTRLGPVTDAIPKAMLPLVDAKDRIRSVVHCILAEASAAGIREVGLVVAPRQKQVIENYLAAARDAGDLPREIEYVLQPKPKGFGDAVLRGADFAGSSDAFLLMLGDHVRVADAGSPPCAAQVIAAFERYGGVAMVGMQDVGAEELPRVGVARGEPIAGGVYLCTDFAEKPDAAAARKRLVTPGLPEGRFLAHCGLYVFTAAIFDCLKALKSSGGRGGELQLADAQSMLLERHPQDYRLLKVAGRAYDTGTPGGYAEAFRRFSVV